MKTQIVLFALILASCGINDSRVYDPKIEILDKVNWRFEYGGYPYYAVDGNVKNVGRGDISPIYPRLDFKTAGSPETAYGLLGDRNIQIFNGPINPTTTLREGETKYFFVRTRVLTNLKPGEEPQDLVLSFEFPKQRD